MTKSEARIKQEILIYLAEQRIFAWNNSTGTALSHDLKRHISFGLPGSPDIIGMLPGGRFLGIETKSKRGTLRKNQENFRDRCIREGGLYITARSISDVAAALQEAGHE